MSASGSSEDLLLLAERVAIEAGALIKNVLAHPSGSAVRAAAQSKTSRTDLVTDADRASEALVCSSLLEARPQDSILGEEDGLHSGTSDITWVVDPLDGTTNFVYGFSSFAVSIAAEREGQTIAGVVHDPMHNETFTALRGGGARLNGKRLLREREPESLGQALIGTGFGYKSDRRAAQGKLMPFVLPAIRDIRRAGAAALDLCYVASGRLDGYFEAGLQPWDRAAGLLVAEEAGCSSIDLEEIVPGGSTLVVGAPWLCEELATLLRDAVAAARSITWPEATVFTS